MKYELGAVITGDVVRSSELRQSERSALPDILREVYSELRSRHEATLPYQIDVFSGDSWQAYVRDPSRALAIALYLRARMKERLNVVNRVVLAVDRVDFLQPESVSESDGPAFRRSGRAVMSLEKTEHFRLLVPEELDTNGPIRLAADSIADLIDHLFLHWTRAQAQAVAHMLINYPDEHRQQDVADAWRPQPISQPAVNKHLRSAGWELVHRSVARYEALIRVILESSSAA